MTTPSTPPPDSTSGSSQAANMANGAQSSQVSDLVDQLTQPEITFDPATIRKGTITATNPTASPPNVSLTISGDTTVIDQVVYLDSYSPVVGDTVLIIKQGTDIAVLGQLNDTSAGSANGWITPTLQSGFTTNGDSQGNLQYRLVIDNGERKVQWRGAVAVSGSNTSIVTGIDTAYRPSFQQKILAARGMGNGNAVLDVQVVFSTSGTVALAGNTYNFPAHTHALGTSASENVTHTHYLGYGTSGDYLGYSYADDPVHAHDMGSSTGTSGTIALPDWVSFNGIEYFL